MYIVACFLYSLFKKFVFVPVASVMTAVHRDRLVQLFPLTSRNGRTDRQTDRWIDNYNVSIMIGVSKFGGSVQDHHTYDMCESNWRLQGQTAKFKSLPNNISNYTVCACSQGIWRNI